MSKIQRYIGKSTLGVLESKIRSAYLNPVKWYVVKHNCRKHMIYY